MEFSWKKKWMPLIFVFIFVEVMLSVSSIMKNPEILFPEASALAAGCWVFKEKRWMNSYRYICILPTLSASAAISLSRLPISLFLKESIALVLIVSVLHLLKSSIGPSISAALLPLVLGIQSWDYVFSVFFLTFVIMLGSMKYKNRTSDVYQIEKQSKRKIVYSVFIVHFILLCYVLKLKIGIIPPLIVVAFEWFHKNDMTRSGARKQIILLTFAALIGTECHQIFPNSHLLSGFLSVLITFLLMFIFGVKVPPALAVSLLPLIIGDLPVWRFPLTVLVESWILSEMAICYFRLESIFSLKFHWFRQAITK